MSDERATLGEVVETLAPLERRAGSAAEKQAAEWIARRLEAAGTEAHVEDARFLDGYAPQLLPLGVAGMATGIVGLTGRMRGLAALLGGAAAAAIADDASNGPRVWRKATTAPRTTWNVVAPAGDLGAERNLVVLAHHDAAPTGLVFDQSFQKWLGRRFPELVDQTNTSLPLWWPIVGGPALAGLGALLRKRKLAAVGTALSAITVALGADVARSPVVPGANDNLSAVAALVALAERLRADPIAGVRVLLVSCGAEEVLQGGIYAFAERHFPELDPGRTWFLNLDTIGSPQLIMLEGEGCFVMEDYPSPEFRDLVARAAERAGVSLRRGQRSRSSTDSVIPARARYPIATLASFELPSKVLSNYHLMTDTPENLDYGTVAEAVTLAYAVAVELAPDA
jgi:Peptidase family M28